MHSLSNYSSIVLFCWHWVYSRAMWLFRILKFVFGLWLRSQSTQGRIIRLAGSHLIGKILRHSKYYTENPLDIGSQTQSGSVGQRHSGPFDTIPSSKRGTRIGLYLLAVLVVLSLLQCHYIKKVQAKAQLPLF